MIVLKRDVANGVFFIIMFIVHLVFLNMVDAIGVVRFTDQAFQVGPGFYVTILFVSRLVFAVISFIFVLGLRTAMISSGLLVEVSPFGEHLLRNYYSGELGRPETAYVIVSLLIALMGTVFVTEVAIRTLGSTPIPY